MSRLADSAGVPWSGRHFTPTAFDGDDGSAPPRLLSALSAFREGRAGQEDVVEALRAVRLLVPLLAQLGESGTGVGGLKADKSAELALVTVAAPGGRRVQPVFTSVEAMSRWNPSARPVPAESERVALAAVAEDTDLLVLDPRSDTEFVVRRPAVWALGRGLPWQPPAQDAEVVAAFRAGATHPAVVGVRLRSGDPEARLAGPEVVAELSLTAGLDRAALDGLVASIAQRWAADELIAERVDSLAIKAVPAGPV